MVSQIGEHEKRTGCGICKIICDEFLFTLLIVNFHINCVFGSVLLISLIMQDCVWNKVMSVSKPNTIPFLLKSQNMIG